MTPLSLSLPKRAAEVGSAPPETSPPPASTLLIFFLKVSLFPDSCVSFHPPFPGSFAPAPGKVVPS